MDNWTGVQPAGKAGEFALGSALVSPALRCVSGLGGRSVLEPRMMQVLVQLAQRPYDPSAGSVGFKKSKKKKKKK